MQFSKIFKPSLYLKNKDSKGIHLKDSIKILKELMNMTDAIPTAMLNSDTNKESKNIKVNSYLKGINDKCLQFEILYEIETKDDDFIDDKLDIANHYISLMNENIEYNIIANKAENVDLYSKSGKVKVVVDGEELFYNVKAVKMNDNNKYYKSVCEFLKSIKQTEIIQEYKVYDKNDNIEFNFNVDSLDSISTEPDEKTKK